MSHQIRNSEVTVVHVLQTESNRPERTRLHWLLQLSLVLSPTPTSAVRRVRVSVFALFAHLRKPCMWLLMPIVSAPRNSSQSVRKAAMHCRKNAGAGVDVDEYRGVCHATGCIMLIEHLHGACHSPCRTKSRGRSLFRTGKNPRNVFMVSAERTLWRLLAVVGQATPNPRRYCACGPVRPKRRHAAQCAIAIRNVLFCR